MFDVYNQKSLYMDVDHQAHVKAYWHEQYRLAALRAPVVKPKEVHPPASPRDLPDLDRWLRFEAPSCDL